MNITTKRFVVFYLNHINKLHSFIMHFKPTKTKYFTFTKLNPFIRDRELLIALAKGKGCFITYYVEWLNEKDCIIEGLIIFHRRLTIWEAAERLYSFNVGFAEDWDEQFKVITKHREVKTLNFHPFCTVTTILFQEDCEVNNASTIE